jgi:hypothetical protein
MKNIDIYLEFTSTMSYYEINIIMNNFKISKLVSHTLFTNFKVKCAIHFQIGVYKFFSLPLLYRIHYHKNL